jgi:hypothetical protein
VRKPLASGIRPKSMNVSMLDWQARHADMSDGRIIDVPAVHLR